MFDNQLKNKKMKGYIRVSTEDQAKEGISLDNQERRIRAYAEMHEIDLIDIVRDEGLSGTHMDRPGLQQILMDLQEDKIDGVLIWALDRLSRKALDVLGLVDEVFNKRKKILCSITEKIDTSSAMGSFVLQVLAAINELEVKRIKERILSNLKMKKEKRERLGTNPFGFKTVYEKRDKSKKRKAGKLVPIMEELKLLKEMIEMREDGLSLASICENLNNRGIKSKQGKKWWPETLRYILKNPKTKIAMEVLDDLEEEKKLEELVKKADKGIFSTKIKEELRTIEEKMFTKEDISLG